MKRLTPENVTAAARAMCTVLYGEGFDLHDHGAQDPEGRAILERAAEAAIQSVLEHE